MNAWAVKNKTGQLIKSTLRATRIEAIKAMVGDEPNYQNRWCWWKRNHGASVVRVLVEPADSLQVCRHCNVVTKLTEAEVFGWDS